MRARRGAYLAFFLVAAIAASALVYLSQPRNGVVRAKVDIPVLTPITADMIQVVSVSPADAPPNAARSVEAVVGRYASVPILAGQDVDVARPRDEPGPARIRLRRAARGRPGRVRHPGRARPGGRRRALRPAPGSTSWPSRTRSRRKSRAEARSRPSSSARASSC